MCLLFGVELGLLFGVVINILRLLFMWARPVTTVQLNEINNIQYIYISPQIGIFFPGIDHLRELANKAAFAVKHNMSVVIECCTFTGLDYTSAKVGGVLILQKKKILILICILNFANRVYVI